ncbi:unnamed protein product [Amoebophrya sp. A120]|nr:unnamed protein product [Amoebophrya sp. A120]|eukprot:GSA120T00014374001.1
MATSCAAATAIMKKTGAKLLYLWAALGGGPGRLYLSGMDGNFCTGSAQQAGGVGDKNIQYDPLLNSLIFLTGTGTNYMPLFVEAVSKKKDIDVDVDDLRMQSFVSEDEEEGDPGSSPVSMTSQSMETSRVLAPASSSDDMLSGHDEEVAEDVLAVLEGTATEQTQTKVDHDDLGAGVVRRPLSAAASRSRNNNKNSSPPTTTSSSPDETTTETTRRRPAGFLERQAGGEPSALFAATLSAWEAGAEVVRRASAGWTTGRGGGHFGISAKGDGEEEHVPASTTPAVSTAAEIMKGAAGEDENEAGHRRPEDDQLLPGAPLFLEGPAEDEASLAEEGSAAAMALSFVEQEAAKEVDVEQQRGEVSTILYHMTFVAEATLREVKLEHTFPPATEVVDFLQSRARRLKEFFNWDFCLVRQSACPAAAFGETARGIGHQIIVKNSEMLSTALVVLWEALGLDKMMFRMSKIVDAKTVKELWKDDVRRLESDLENVVAILKNFPEVLRMDDSDEVDRKREFKSLENLVRLATHDLKQVLTLEQETLIGRPAEETKEHGQRLERARRDAKSRWQILVPRLKHEQGALRAETARGGASVTVRLAFAMEKVVESCKGAGRLEQKETKEKLLSAAEALLREFQLAFHQEALGEDIRLSAGETSILQVAIERAMTDLEEEVTHVDGLFGKAVSPGVPQPTAAEVKLNGVQVLMRLREALEGFAQMDARLWGNVSEVKGKLAVVAEMTSVVSACASQLDAFRGGSAESKKQLEQALRTCGRNAGDQFHNASIHTVLEAGLRSAIYDIKQSYRQLPLPRFGEAAYDPSAPAHDEVAIAPGVALSSGGAGGARPPPAGSSAVRPAAPATVVVPTGSATPPPGSAVSSAPSVPPAPAASGFSAPDGPTPPVASSVPSAPIASIAPADGAAAAAAAGGLLPAVGDEPTTEQWVLQELIPLMFKMNDDILDLFSRRQHGETVTAEQVTNALNELDRLCNEVRTTLGEATDLVFGGISGDWRDFILEELGVRVALDSLQGDIRTTIERCATNHFAKHELEAVREGLQKCAWLGGDRTVCPIVTFLQVKLYGTIFEIGKAFHEVANARSGPAADEVPPAPVVTVDMIRFEILPGMWAVEKNILDLFTRRQKNEVVSADGVKDALSELTGLCDRFEAGLRNVFEITSLNALKVSLKIRNRLRDLKGEISSGIRNCATQNFGKPPGEYEDVRRGLQNCAPPHGSGKSPGPIVTYLNVKLRGTIHDIQQIFNEALYKLNEEEVAAAAAAVAPASPAATPVVPVVQPAQEPAALPTPEGPAVAYGAYTVPVDPRQPQLAVGAGGAAAAAAQAQQLQIVPVPQASPFAQPAGRGTTPPAGAGAAAAAAAQQQRQQQPPPPAAPPVPPPSATPKKAKSSGGGPCGPGGGGGGCR